MFVVRSAAKSVAKGSVGGLEGDSCQIPRLEEEERCWCIRHRLVRLVRIDCSRDVGGEVQEVGVLLLPHNLRSHNPPTLPLNPRHTPRTVAEADTGGVVEVEVADAVAVGVDR